MKTVTFENHDFIVKDWVNYITKDVTGFSAWEFLPALDSTGVIYIDGGDNSRVQIVKSVSTRPVIGVVIHKGE